VWRCSGSTGGLVCAQGYSGLVDGSIGSNAASKLTRRPSCHPTASQASPPPLPSCNSRLDDTPRLRTPDLLPCSRTPEALERCLLRRVVLPLASLASPLCRVHCIREARLNPGHTLSAAKPQLAAVLPQYHWYHSHFSGFCSVRGSGQAACHGIAPARCKAKGYRVTIHAMPARKVVSNATVQANKQTHISRIERTKVGRALCRCIVAGPGRQEPRLQHYFPHGQPHHLRYFSVPGWGNAQHRSTAAVHASPRARSHDTRVHHCHLVARSILHLPVRRPASPESAFQSASVCGVGVGVRASNNGDSGVTSP
jgi:hypothetical protein